jgi:hypothetical protein
MSGIDWPPVLCGPAAALETLVPAILRREMSVYEFKPVCSAGGTMPPRDGGPAANSTNASASTAMKTQRKFICGSACLCHKTNKYQE